MKRKTLILLCALIVYMSLATRSARPARCPGNAATRVAVDHQTSDWPMPAGVAVFLLWLVRSVLGVRVSMRLDCWTIYWRRELQWFSTLELLNCSHLGFVSFQHFSSSSSKIMCQSLLCRFCHLYSLFYFLFVYLSGFKCVNCIIIFVDKNEYLLQL